jgi:hypothetical protein
MKADADLALLLTILAILLVAFVLIVGAKWMINIQYNDCTAKTYSGISDVMRGISSTSTKPSVYEVAAGDCIREIAFVNDYHEYSQAIGRNIEGCQNDRNFYFIINPKIENPRILTRQWFFKLAGVTKDGPICFGVYKKNIVLNDDNCKRLVGGAGIKYCIILEKSETQTDFVFIESCKKIDGTTPCEVPKNT